MAADAAAPTPANQGSASAEGAEFIEEDLQQDPPGNGDLLGAPTPPGDRGGGGGVCVCVVVVGGGAARRAVRTELAEHEMTGYCGAE